jgi:ubiquinone/menaquinone biosynthesis C-methylase UbiE
MRKSKLSEWLFDTSRAFLPRKFSVVEKFYDSRYVDRTENFSRSQKWEDEVLRLMMAAGLQSGARVLDVGCNTGRLVDVLSSALPAFRYTGVDINKAAFERTQARSGENATFMFYDGSVLPVQSDSVDVAVFNHSLGHVSDVMLSLRESYRVLAPGGSIAIATPNRLYKRAKAINNLFNDYSPDLTVLRYFSIGTLKSALHAAGFVSTNAWLEGEAAIRAGGFELSASRSRIFCVAQKPKHRPQEEL